MVQSRWHGIIFWDQWVSCPSDPSRPLFVAIISHSLWESRLEGSWHHRCLWIEFWECIIFSEECFFSSTNISCLLRKKSLEKSLDAQDGRLGGEVNFWVCLNKAVFYWEAIDKTAKANLTDCYFKMNLFCRINLILHFRYNSSLGPTVASSCYQAEEMVRLQSQIHWISC